MISPSKTLFEERKTLSAVKLALLSKESGRYQVCLELEPKAEEIRQERNWNNEGKKKINKIYVELKFVAIKKWSYLNFYLW